MDDDSTEVDGRRTDTRARILETASRYFRERGYSSTSLQEIADDLGVTKAALYYHFASKTEILHALIEPVFTAVEEILARAVDCSTAAGRRDYLALLVATFNATGPDVASIATDPRAADGLLEAFSSTMLHERVAAQLVDGLVREGRAKRAAAEFRAAGALSSVYGMVEAWGRDPAGSGSMDEQTQSLVVAVAAAALEADAS